MGRSRIWATVVCLALLAAALAPTGARAATDLDGLEMDVMVGGETPAQAAHRIALPVGASRLELPERPELDDQETLIDGPGPDAGLERLAPGVDATLEGSPAAPPEPGGR